VPRAALVRMNPAFRQPPARWDCNPGTIPKSYFLCASDSRRAEDRACPTNGSDRGSLSLARSNLIRWARYDLAKPGTFRLEPTGTVLAAVEADYRAMANMIFGEVPTLDRVMNILRGLENEINGKNLPDPNGETDEIPIS